MASLHVMIAVCLITIAASGLLPISYAQSIGDTRLSGSCSGRLEVYLNDLIYGEQWYQVCDRGMDDTEARVICRQLGCPATYATTTHASFGYTFRIYYVPRGYRCLGSEHSLSSCRQVSGQCTSTSIDGGDNDHVAITCPSSTPPPPPPPPPPSPVDGCIGGTQCRDFSSYCPSNGKYSASCVSGSGCRCIGQINRDYCTCLPKVGSCQIQKGLPTAIGIPTYRRESRITYSCVATNNCMYDVHVVSSYDSVSSFSHTAGTATVNLTVNGPSQGAKPLVLVLVTYEPVRWTLYVPSGVTIERVLLASYYLETSSVSGVSSQIVERIPYQTLPSGYGDDSGGGSTDELLMYVVKRFGPVASFSGTYRADRWELVVQRTPIGSNCMQSTVNGSSIGAEPEIGDIRLSDGCSGELEVYSNPLNSEGWYSVCAASSGFYNIESRVVCKQLGCPVDGASSTFSTSVSSLPSLTAQFTCYGSESALSECQQTTDQCSNTEIITVQCADSTPHSPSPPPPYSPSPEIEMSSAQAQAQAGGIAVGVIAFAGCIIALFIGVVCYRKGICKKNTPHPQRNNHQTPITTYPLASLPPVGSNTMNLNNAYATTFVTTTSPNGTQHLYQQPQHPYQPLPSYVHSTTTTLDEPSHLKATTHAGEAPPAYHAAMYYETITVEDYKSLKLSEGSTVYSAKPDNGNTDTPPTYSEISGQKRTW